MAGRVCGLSKRHKEVSGNSSKLRDATSQLHEVDNLKKKLREKEEALQNYPSKESMNEALLKRDHDISENQKAITELQEEVRSLKERLCECFTEKDTINSRIEHLETEKRESESELSGLKQRLSVQEELLKEVGSIKEHVKMRDKQIGEYVIVVQNMQQEIRVLQDQVQNCKKEKEAFCEELDNLKREKEENVVRSEIILLVKEFLEVLRENKNKELFQKKRGEEPKAPKEPQSFDIEESVSSGVCLLKVNPEYDPLFRKYSIGRLLDKSVFGQVRVAKRLEDNLPVAIKFTELPLGQPWIQTPNQETQVPMEIGLMQLVSGAAAHPGIIQLLDWCIGTSKIALVMELLDPSMNLTEFIMNQGGFLAEEKAKSIFSQVVEAVQHCHYCWVFHGDLKPDNILIQTNTEKIKLIDFGCGTVLQENEDYTHFPGSLLYAPPEWFMLNRYRAVPATVWSLGVTFFELLCGHRPFMRTDDIVKVRFTFSRELSTECQDLIKKCLSFIPLERPTLKEIHNHLASQKNLGSLMMASFTCMDGELL